MFATNRTTLNSMFNKKYGLSAIAYLNKMRIENASIMLTNTATFTLPDEMWAEMIEEGLREQASGLEVLAGIEIEITRNGNVVTAINLNVEAENTTKAEILKLIIAMDILNARPIGTAIF